MEAIPHYNASLLDKGLAKNLPIKVWVATKDQLS